MDGLNGVDIRFGVSRMGSGSHLMACVLAFQKWGAEAAEKLQFVIVKDLEGARAAMRAGEIDVFMWEKFTTKHVCECGEWKLIGEVPTPWPCFSFVASRRALKERGAEIKTAISVTAAHCDKYILNEGESTVNYVSENHKLSLEDSAAWLHTVRYDCAPYIRPQTLDSVRELLVAAGVLDETCLDLPHVFYVAQIKDSPMVCVIGEVIPETMYSWRLKALMSWISAKEAELGRQLTMEDMCDAGHLDQYHYLGIASNDSLIKTLQLSSNDRVLDIGAGIGGPARYIAYKAGCRIVGVELQNQLVVAGNDVADAVGLRDLVEMVRGDACDATLNLNVLPGCASFDAAYSLLVILHIPEEPRQALFRNINDKLKDDGVFLIEDFVCRKPFSADELDMLRHAVGAHYVADEEAYGVHLRAAGFVDIEFHDLSSQWTAWTKARWESLVADKEAAIAKSGASTYEQRELFYRRIYQLFADGRLGGSMITCRKPSAGELRLQRGRAVRDAEAGAVDLKPTEIH
mmetsp:Transcript_20093/g.53536  ORF Transcript_20093/g.53536 Transcript_20093/m.53536 type:complete len:517 (+) Transcript_20093:315-1865(+)